MTASPAESSCLISKLESSSISTPIYSPFSDYLHPFTDLTKKSLNENQTLTLTRSLAKNFLPFVNRCLSILPKRLSDLINSSSVKEEQEDGKVPKLVIELFDTYRLCLDCLELVSSQLAGKPYAVYRQRLRLVCCLEAWGLYRDGENEGFRVLERLRALDLGPKPKNNKKKKLGKYLPVLLENGDLDFAKMVVEAVVAIMKCVALGKSKNDDHYKRVIGMIQEVKPWFRSNIEFGIVPYFNLGICELWFSEANCIDSDLKTRIVLPKCYPNHQTDRVLDADAYDKLHRMLVTYLRKCTQFLVGELMNFDGGIVRTFCTTTLDEYAESSMKDQIYKFARHICSLFFLQGDRSSVKIDVLMLSLSSICLYQGLLVKLDGLVQGEAQALDQIPAQVAQDWIEIYSEQAEMKIWGIEFIELVAYCANKCQAATTTLCITFAECLDDLAGVLCQVMTPLEMIIKLYAIGLSFVDHIAKSVAGDVMPSKGAKDEHAVGILDGVTLCNLAPVLGSLRSYFYDGCKENCVSCGIEFQDFACDITLDSHHGTSLNCTQNSKEVYLLAYLNVLKFLCKPLSELVISQNKQIIFESDASSLSSMLCSIQEAFHQFSDIVLYFHRSTAESEAAGFDENKMILSVSVATFILSIRTKHGLQDMLLFSQTSILLMGLPFLITEEYASDKADHCEASWKCVKLLCEMYMQKADGFVGDLSEDAILDFVTEACNQTVFLLDVLHKSGSLRVEKIIVNSLENWSVAENLFRRLSVPVPLVKQWVKFNFQIRCEINKNTAMDDNAPTLHCLLSLSMTMSKRTIGKILQQELLAYEEMHAMYPEFCQRMQMGVIDVLLKDVYVTDSHLQKSRVLVRKGWALRSCGFEGLGDCIQCLSEAISVLQVFGDIQAALDLWLSIPILDYGFAYDEGSMLPDSALLLLYNIVDLLAMKGSMEFHNDIYKLMIRLFKWKDIQLHTCLSILWESKRLTHALCVSPVNEAFIMNLPSFSGEQFRSFDSWIHCLKGSPPSLVGFQHNFSYLCTNFPCGSENHKTSFQSDVTVDVVKEAAFEVISSVPVTSNSFFIAGCLYYDLCERLIANGRLFELYIDIGNIDKEGHQRHKRSMLDVATAKALSYAKEAHRLRTKLFKETFMYTVEKKAEKLTYGKLYCKKGSWDLSEKELQNAKHILVHNCADFSCLKCGLMLEATIDQQLGDLSLSLFNTTRSVSIERLSLAENFYRSALDRLNYREWKNSVSCPEDVGEIEGASVCFTTGQLRPKMKMESQKYRKTKKAMKSLLKEQSSVTENHTRLTRSRYRSSQNQNVDSSAEVQVGLLNQLKGNRTHDIGIPNGQRQWLSGTKGCMVDLGCEITCICNGKKCWFCLAREVKESGLLSNFICLKWEFVRRRLSVRLLSGIGKCLEVHGRFHEAHEIISQSISVLVSRNPFAHACIPFTFLLDLVGKELSGDVFSVERAAVLYNICWFSLKSYSSKDNRTVCCDLFHVQIPKIVSWLMLAYVLCREVPALLQKYCLYTYLAILNALCLVMTGEYMDALSQINPFSVVLDLGFGLRHGVSFCNRIALTLGFAMVLTRIHLVIAIGSCVTASACEGAEICNFPRLAPESLQDLEQFVIDFYSDLPCTTCMDAVVTLELQESTYYDASAYDDCAMSGTGEFVVSNNLGKHWHCPWGSTVVDDVAPAFRFILEENYLSSSEFPLEDTKENRTLWWTKRKKLDNRLGKLLRKIEDSWLGLWRYVLLGDWFNCSHLDSVMKKLVHDLKSKCKINTNESFLKVILQGGRHALDEEACISLLLSLKKGCFIAQAGYSEEERCETFSKESERVKRLAGLAVQLLHEAVNELEEEESIIREPVILVLDCEVQMLPWENIPILRNQEVYRMPSVGSICFAIDRSCCQQEQVGKITGAFPLIDPLDAFYLLNPGGDLSSTQVEFENWFRDQNLEGKAGSAPTSEELSSALKNHDLFIYFGHGSGAQYISQQEIQKLENCAATLLMGCSSGCLSLNGCYAPKGTALSYLLAGSPVTVANLWEVTDKDIDRFGKAMLDAWLKERSSVSLGCDQCNLVAKEFEAMNIKGGKRNAKKKAPGTCYGGSAMNSCEHRPKIGAFMGQAREACTLTYLIGASPVCYGIPTGIRRKKDL
ncbi:unnamed protein product [Dovyalis caffra]|uniref:separase n=1 Tax=Dovyalis caffra TaxID=77055 RepID=A0AAV1SSI1_9ROSI|nr:unnamed protein product [Dovyalis caffra]